MVSSFANFHVSTKAALLALMIASPWLIVQIGIVILGPDREITEMPVCDSTSGNCAHLGGGDDYRLNEQLPTLVELPAESVYNNLIGISKAMIGISFMRIQQAAHTTFILLKPQSFGSFRTM